MSLTLTLLYNVSTFSEPIQYKNLVSVLKNSYAECLAVIYCREVKNTILKESKLCAVGQQSRSKVSLSTNNNIFTLIY